MDITQTKTYKNVLKTLNHYDYVINHNRRDSEAFSKAENKGNDLIFGNISLRKVGFLAKLLPESKRTNKTLAKAITVAKLHKSVPEVFHLSKSDTLNYLVISIKENSKLSTSNFYKEYGISKSRLEDIEDGDTSMTQNEFYKFIHSVDQALTNKN